MAAPPPTPAGPLDYQQLASLLDTAASEQQRLATTTAGDPIAQYQSSVNAQLFSAARRCAQDHARSHPRTPPAPLTVPPRLGGQSPATDPKGALIEAAQP
jgi:hypothetical protein